MKPKRVFMVILLASVASIHAQSFDDQIALSIEEFSKAYIKAYPDRGVRAGLVILDMEELSELARQNKVGVAVATRLAEELDQSLAFVLVDRKNLEKLLSEMEFSMSGMVDESTAIRVGELTGAKAFVSGTITEERDVFRIALSLTDGQEGAVMATRAFDLPRKELIKAAVDLQYQYVAKHGLGLTMAPLIPVYGYSDLFNKSAPIFFDLAILYRPSRFLQVGGGVLSSQMGTGELYRYDTERAQNIVQPQIPDYSEAGYWGYFPHSGFTISQETARFNITLMHLDGQYTINVTPWLNLGLTGGVLMTAGNPTMLVERASGGKSLYYRQLLATPAPYATGDIPTWEDYYTVPAKDEAEFTYLFQPAYTTPGFKAELRPEVFITPRIALYAKIGYQWMPTMQVRQIHAAHADWYFYQEDKDPSTWDYDESYDPSSTDTWENMYNNENRSSWIYYGLNPLLRPDGSRYVLDLTAFYAQAGISFYF